MNTTLNHFKFNTQPLSTVSLRMTDANLLRTRRKQPINQLTSKATAGWGAPQASVGGASRLRHRAASFAARARATSRLRAALKPISFRSSVVPASSEAHARGGAGAFESQRRLLGSGGRVVTEVLKVRGCATGLGWRHRDLREYRSP